MTAATNVVAIRQAEPGGSLSLANSQTEWTPPQRAALAQLGLHDAPDADLAVFLHQAQRTGLDPFARQIYMIGRWDNRSGKNKYTIQTGIDGFRIVADRRPEYGGQVGPEWCGEDGVWRDVWTARTPPAAARVGVIRRGWERPIYATALFREYAGYTGKGDLTKMWSEKGTLMIAKCAEALALRKAFPQDLSGIYTSEEMTQANSGNDARVVIDQPAAEPAAPAVDWDAEIAKVADDADALRAMWKTAPSFEVRKKIEAAVGVATGQDPEPDGVVDAEIVEAPAGSDLNVVAVHLVDALMVLHLPEHVATIIDTDITGKPVAAVDVSGLLTEEDREVLAVEDGPLPLVKLAGLVLSYSERHNRSPRGALDAGEDHRWDAAGVSGYEL